MSSAMQRNLTSTTRTLCCVVPHLYVGDVNDSKNKQLLKANNISYILPVGNRLPRYYPNDFHYFPSQIDVLDSTYEDLLTYFDECYEFIENARNAGENVFVHCVGGFSRSVTITMAYLMKKYNLKMETAFEIVKSKRESIYPNEGFLDQLKIYEQLQCKVDIKSDLYKGFKNYISVNKSEQTIIYL